jgi:hypothetical protein
VRQRISDPGAGPVAARAVPLKDNEPPSKLNEAAAYASVAGFGESLFPTLCTTLSERVNPSARRSARSSVPEIPNQNFPDQHIRALGSNADYPGQ